MSLEVMRLIKVKTTLDPMFRNQLLSNPLRFLQAYDPIEGMHRSIVREARTVGYTRRPPWLTAK